MSALPLLQEPRLRPRRVPRSVTRPARKEGTGLAAPLAGGAGDSASVRLRQLLVLTDTLAAWTAWSLALLLQQPARQGAAELLSIAALTLITLTALAGRRLYRARVAQFRSQEIQQLGHVAVVAGLSAGALSHWAGTVTAGTAASGAALTFACLLLGRSLYRGWVDGHRREGRFHRPVVLLGTNDEAEHLLELLADHPELGLTAVGVIGVAADHHSRQLPVPYLGDVADAPDAVTAAGANGVLIASTAVEPQELNAVIRRLLDRQIHVQLSSGLSGISHRRLRANPLAHEPLFYVEALEVSPWQRAVKRGMDIVLGSVLLALAAPVLLAAALVIKLDDRGPVFFRHARVGRGGRTFQMLKLRTMVPDAERHYDELAPALAARQGPLVKLHHDPRLTRVGRFLRATSIDELPQLLHVIAGTMSLVGPRPNLVAEVPGLDPDYLARKASVRPGITGLWQVEARDKPSVNTYMRLDLFYLENWSLSLDLAVLFATAEHLTARLRVAFRRPTLRAGTVIE